jgi:hypothetical protein
MQHHGSSYQFYKNRHTQQIVIYHSLVFKQTRKHLDSLQVEIVKGVLNGQKYPEIAKKYKCSKGHVKDEAYKGKFCQRV